MGVTPQKYNYKLSTVWRETLAPIKFGEIDDRPKIRQIFTIQFLHIYRVSRE